MKTKNKHLGVLLIFFISFSCMDFIDSRVILVENNSKKSIYSVMSDKDGMIGSTGFYDEFEDGSSSRDSLFSFIFKEIEPGMKIENHDSPKIWESYFDKISDKQIRLYIISKDNVNKYGWKKIFHDTIHNKKYKLSLVDLEKSNWKIIYSE